MVNIMLLMEEKVQKLQKLLTLDPSSQAQKELEGLKALIEEQTNEEYYEYENIRERGNRSAKPPTRSI